MFVERVQALATLATAEAHVKEVIKDEDNKFFGKDIPIDLPIIDLKERECPSLLSLIGSTFISNLLAVV
jgi:hypothetical protein